MLTAAAIADPTRIGLAADRALRLELDAAPKPGLVSSADRGSHDDMDHHAFRRSILSLRPFWRRFAEAGRDGADLPELRRIGLEAEAAMAAATGGINTHRGAIFALGLLAVAAGSGTGRKLGAVVAERWGAAIREAPLGGDGHAAPLGGDSHGARVFRRFGAGGARAEAASGFPSVYRVALPALRRARRIRPGDADAAGVEACLALIAVVEDTNLLHRGGIDGLRFAQDAAAGFLRAGGVAAPDWRARAEALHVEFVRRRLSPGGSADLLASALFVDAVEAEACA